MLRDYSFKNGGIMAIEKKRPGRSLAFDRTSTPNITLELKVKRRTSGAKLKLDDPDYVEEKINEYLKMATEDGIPLTIEGLASHFQVSRRTLNNYMREYKDDDRATVREVSDMLQQFKAHSQMDMMTGALRKKYDSSISKFALLNSDPSEYGEKQEVKLSGIQSITFVNDLEDIETCEDME
jgi:hypothetical protein